jgi:RNA polymerase sigma-70 factor (ECF subfamily)
MLDKNLLFAGKKKTCTSVFSNKSGKHRRFESLAGAYSSDLYRFAYWLCGDHSIADDLVQETFLRAWKSLDNLEDEKKAKSWLLTILRRENARRFERKQLDLVDIESYSIEDEHIPGPEQLAEQGEIHQAILQLEKNYREPLLLQTIGGFKTAEIAQMLKLNINTINTRLFRARNHLKKVLDIADNSSEKGLEQF